MQQEITRELVQSWLPQRQADSNKSSYGSVLAAAGSLAYRGAAALCAEGALRGGAGLVYLASVEPVVQMVLARTPECCACGCRTAAGGGIHPQDAAALRSWFAEKHAVLLAGPGLGEGAGEVCRALLGKNPPWAGAVLDADALNALAAGRLRDPLPENTILTPHPGEAARLLGCTVADVQADREQAVLRLAETYHCVAVLKGSGTLIAAPGGELLHNAAGNAGLAPGRQRGYSGRADRRAAGRRAEAEPHPRPNGRLRRLAARHCRRPLCPPPQHDRHAAHGYFRGFGGDFGGDGVVRGGVPLALSLYRVYNRTISAYCRKGAVVMPRKEGQKRKLLVLLEILARETDEKHPLSVPQLVEELQEHGVVAERKSVYDDLNTLNNLPDSKYEIVQQRGRGGGYYMTETPFELAELKLLVDAVYASKFITARKSKILIDKLGQFTSKYRQAELDRKVLVSGRIKSTDEKILYTVDALHTAITAGQQVQFKYCDWNLQKRMTPRHDGQLYRVSPWVLVWENGNYYLIAYTEGRLKHYRVDKMQNVHQLPDTTREGAEEYANFDVNAYMQQMFGMFNGPLKRVTLLCENRFAGAMIDRFGTGPILTPCPDGEHFTMTAEIQVSPQFFGWVAGFGTGVVVSGPPEVRAEMKKTLDQLQELYR